MNHLVHLNVLQLPRTLVQEWRVKDLQNRAVAASLHRRKRIWEILFPQDQFVKNIIPHRLFLPLIQWPIQRLVPTPPVPSVTVDTEVKKLLKMGAAKVTTFPKKGQHFVQRMFDIPKKRSLTGERRPILDCRPLNRFIATSHFKMEGLHTVKELLQSNDWMTSIDLKSAYLQVGINPRHQRLLTFQWREKFIHFTTLPFGLNIAPRTFSKIMRRAIQIAREFGIRIVYYLDDTLILAKSPAESLLHTALWALILTELGFVINWDKSQLTPLQIVRFLGVQIDSMKMSFSLPDDKIQMILGFCQRLIQSPLQKKYAARELAGYLGTLNATSECFTPCKMFTHFLHKDLMRALDQGWTKGRSTLSPEAREELQWWRDHLPLLNGQSIRNQTLATFRLQTDASSRGWGGVLFQPDHYQIYAQGLWTSQQQAQSNNVREMTAVVQCLQEFQPPDGRNLSKGTTESSSRIGQYDHSEHAGSKWNYFSKSFGNAGVAAHSGISIQSSSCLSTRSTKRNSGWFEQNPSDLHDGELPPSSYFRSYRAEFRSAHRRPICQPLQSPTSKIRDLEEAPQILAGRRFQPSMDSAGRSISEPTVCVDCSMSKQDSDRQSNGGARRTGLASAAVVATAAKTSQKPASDIAIPPESFYGSRRTSSVSGVDNSRVAFIRRELGGRRFSSHAVDTVLESWKDARDYDSAWKCWADWCAQHKVSLRTFDTAAEANFVSDMRLERKWRANTAITNCSRIRATMEVANGNATGTAFRRGLCRSLPNTSEQPEFTFDISQVERHLSQCGSAVDKSIKSLRSHTLALFSLYFGCRSSDKAHVLRDVGIQLSPSCCTFLEHERDEVSDQTSSTIMDTMV